MIDYKIWCTYHDKKLIEEYNLRELNNFKLFYTKENFENNVISLNYVQEFLNEWVTQYYVWKNNIKSDLVGFCHYRRNIYQYINDDLLNHVYNYSQYKTFITAPVNIVIKGNYLYDCNDYSILMDYKFFGLELHYDLILNYIKENYSSYIYERTIKVFNSVYSRQNYGEIYICKWNIFCELMKFIDEYIKYLFNKLCNLPIKELYEYTYEEYDNLSHYLNNENFRLRKEYIDKIFNLNTVDTSKFQFAGYPRSIAFMIEYIIGIFWNIFINGNNYT